MKFGKLVDYDRDCRPSYSGFTGRPDKDGTRSRPLQRKWHEVLHGCRPFGSFLFDGLGYRVGKSRSKLTCSCEGPCLLSPENFWKPICCILVTTCCEISCFFKTTAKKLGDQYIVGPPNLKVGDQSPYLRLLRLCYGVLLVSRHLHTVDYCTRTGCPTE